MLPAALADSTASLHFPTLDAGGVRMEHSENFVEPKRKSYDVNGNTGSFVAGVLPIRRRRDLRLDLFRGLANWAIFLDHIPNNAVALLTARNYGFSDAAELFVFISGYTAALASLKAMHSAGFLVGALRLMRRVWQIYVAHVLLFVFYVAAIGWIAQTYNYSNLLHEFNVAGLVADPIAYLGQGLALRFKPLNMDVLPLYILLMASFPFILRAMMSWPNRTLLCSLALYFLARQFDWNLTAWPAGVWYFNPFAWQFLFVLGARCALGLPVIANRLVDSRIVLWLCAVFLAFALAVSIAEHFDLRVSTLASWMSEGLAPDGKTNLAPARVVHFLALAILAVFLITRDEPWLRSSFVRPIVLCGRRSLEVFCVGVFLSFVARSFLELISSSLAMQVVVSVGGIAVLTAVAWIRSWCLERVSANGSMVLPPQSY